ncbi:adhesin biosynthesis transcription regulatory family protein [Escherichia coli]|nr:adhesin biosynthesis transcription regulatory family protein [Escherichia coli]
MRDNCLFLTKTQDESLMPGEMPELQFWLLVEISPIHSEKIILALKDFLVMGYSRKEVCERHNVSPGYFSGALGRFQRVHLTVVQLTPYYSQPKKYMLDKFSDAG